jgi:deazaflavin-dependent oxidoreductase (nitroreductase family)
MAGAARLGVGPGYLQLLTVTGRKSGERRTTPVQLVIEGQRRWLVAPYGEVQWVKNARAAASVTLSRGRHSADYTIEQITGTEAGRILKKYVKIAPVVVPYFEAGLTSSAEEFASEAETHPVFVLSPVAEGRGG